MQLQRTADDSMIGEDVLGDDEVKRVAGRTPGGGEEGRRNVKDGDHR